MKYDNIEKVKRFPNDTKLYTAPPAAQPPMPVQEPVAWVCYGAPGKRDIDFEEADINGLPIGTLLYTTPPAAQPVEKPMHPQIQKMYEDYFDKCFRESSAQKHPWVGLTDEEIDEADEQTWAEDRKSWGIHDFARAVEAKLKDKNS